MVAKTAPAPEQQVMDRAALSARFGEVADEGVTEFVTMKDGWKLKRESWTPPAETTPAKAVLLFFHGTGESTRTVGVRRLAHACTKRGIILEMYDRHGHGDSLEKNGKPFAHRGFQGFMVDTKGTNTEHAVEIAELVLKKHHSLPLIIGGHSGGGETACMATDRIITLCAEKNVKFVTGIYAAPGVGVLNELAPCGLCCFHYCCGCCWLGCCCNCCGRPCIKAGGQDHFNPDGCLGPDNVGKGYVNCDQLWTESAPYPKGSASVPDAVGAMTKLQSGLVHYGSEDKAIPKKSIEKLVAGVPALTLEIREGEPHDMLNMNADGDRTSSAAIDFMLAFAEAQLSKQGDAPTAE